MKLVQSPKGRRAKYSEMEYFDSKGAQEKGGKAKGWESSPKEGAKSGNEKGRKAREAGNGPDGGGNRMAARGKWMRRWKAEAAAQAENGTGRHAAQWV